MVVADTWGGEIVTAALAHLVAFTPAELHVNSNDLHNYVIGAIGTPVPQTRGGCLIPSDAPGLGRVNTLVSYSIIRILHEMWISITKPQSLGFLYWKHPVWFIDYSLIIVM